MISVAMTTYNGEKFVLKQIDSILNQSKNVDEVIICDDGSSDKTVDIIIKYIEDNNIKNVKIFINDKNKGFAKNFWDCISLTKGDIVFLSDQDDIWDYYKVEKMTKILEDDKITSVFAEMNYIDANDEILKFQHGHGDGIISTIKHFFCNKVYNLNYKNFIKTGGYQGASIAFKRFIFDDIKNTNVENAFAHDVFINFYSCLLDGFYITKDKLTNYRLHSNNTLGIPLYNKRDRIEVLSESIRICTELKNIVLNLKDTCKSKNHIDTKEVLKYIDNLTNVYNKRIDNVKNKKLLSQIFLISKIYYFSSLKTYIGDIKSILFNN